MTRRISALLLVVATTGLVPGTAEAKGSALEFDEVRNAPGDRAAAYAIVETWPGSGQPEDGPYAVYLVSGGQPLWFGHLPDTAIRVGELRIEGSVADDRYRVTAAFEVPRIPDGRYAVWVCRKECGANSAFGDLVYGRIVVDRDAGGTASPSGREPTTGATPARTRAFPWAGAALSVVLALAVAGVMIGRRHRPATGTRSRS